MTPFKVNYFVSPLSVALTLNMAMAHLLELPDKLKLSYHDYLTVQQIYKGWALIGIVVPVALAATVILTVMRH